MGMAFPATYRSVAVFSIEDMFVIYIFSKGDRLACVASETMSQSIWIEHR